MSTVGGRLLCTSCGFPALHDAHVSTDPEKRICREYKRPPRKVRREQMAAHSDKMQAHYDEERIPEVIAVQGAPCEVRVSDRIPVGPRYRCTGSAVDIHEIVRRSQAGGLIPALQYETKAICRPCHDWISRHPAGARALGYDLRPQDIGIK